MTVTSTQAPCSAPGIAGVLPSGMLDWPGRVAATVFLGGCGFRCPYCHNPELLSAPRRPVDLERLLGALEAKRAWLDGVVVSGGEPTLDPALFDLLRELSRRGFPVKLDTNGSAPEVLGDVLSAGLASFVALDVKALPERYDLATRTEGMWQRVERSIALVLESGVDHEFRTTCYPTAVDTADLPGIAARLAGGRRYVLQQFRSQRTLDAGAASVRPHPADSLRRAALCCSVHVPTVVRGV